MKKGKINSELPFVEEISETNNAAPRSRKKKIIIIAFAAMLLLGVISAVILYVVPAVSDRIESTPKDTGDAADTVGMYGSQSSYLHYPIDDELDPFSVEEYTQLDRTVHYIRNGESVALTDENIDEYGDDVKFFVMYFYYVITGDYETYNTLFTDNYYKSAEPYYSFTPQMVYDIETEYLGESDETGGTVYKYDVSYKIYRNNGTFRNDIGSDASKTLYFELTEQDGKILIDRIDYYR